MTFPWLETRFYTFLDENELKFYIVHVVFINL
jgi:hypothetical protein